MFSIFKKDTGMILIVGLGNHGDEYAKNRHNIGFMAVDAVHDEYRIKPYRKKFQGLAAEGAIDAQKVVLLKPQTYMNNSGQSVAAACKFYKIPPARIIVIHDELDLAVGDNRVKVGGGLAGHNGLKSMKAHLSSADFTRIRIGIDRPTHKGAVSNYVLSDFAKADLPKINGVCTHIARHIGMLLEGHHDDFGVKIVV